MSLTSLLNLKDVKAKFREVFPKPKITDGELVAAPVTQNYMLVGTAFDYLLRFYLEQRYPFAVAQPWIASHAEFLVKPHSGLHKRVTLILEDAKKQYDDFLTKGVVTDVLLRSCLLLAQLDPIFRRNAVVPDLGQINDGDVLDLRQLLASVRSEIFHPQSVCLLDPSFGAGSVLVGGADIDLVLDDTLVEIKTTKQPRLQQDHYNQIIGYYLLSKVGGIDGAPSGHTIQNVAIYSARYATLHVFPIEKIASQATFASFAQWFSERAKQEFRNKQTKRPVD